MNNKINIENKNNINLSKTHFSSVKTNFNTSQKQLEIPYKTRSLIWKWKNRRFTPKHRSRQLGKSGSNTGKFFIVNKKQIGGAPPRQFFKVPTKTVNVTNNKSDFLLNAIVKTQRVEMESYW